MKNCLVNWQQRQRHLRNRDDDTWEYVDAALLPIGGTFTMDIEEAVEAAIAIQPRVVIPMHRSKADPQDYVKKVEAISNIKVAPLQIGEVYHLN